MGSIESCICDIFDLKESDNLVQKQSQKESQKEIDFIYNQSNKSIIQEFSNEAFRTKVLSSGKLDILFLISQRQKYETHYSQRMERIQKISIHF